MKEHKNFNYLWKYEPDIANGFREILFEKLNKIQRMYELINVLLPSNFTVFDCYYFLCCSLQRAEAAQAAQINQLFQFLNLICIYSYIFYGLTCMLIDKYVNNDLTMNPIIRTCFWVLRTRVEADGNLKNCSKSLSLWRRRRKGQGIGRKGKREGFFFFSLMLESNDIFLLELKLHIGEKRSGKLSAQFQLSFDKKVELTRA